MQSKTKHWQTMYLPHSLSVLSDYPANISKSTTRIMNDLTHSQFVQTGVIVLCINGPANSLRVQCHGILGQSRYRARHADTDSKVRWTKDEGGGKRRHLGVKKDTQKGRSSNAARRSKQQATIPLCIYSTGLHILR